MSPRTHRLQRIPSNEEEHVGFLDRQFDLIERIGIQNYILLNSAPAPDQEPAAGKQG